MDEPSAIRRFWNRFQDGSHPEDEPIFAAHPDHTFNLAFPPSAFIGDPDRAPIVVLMSNGGYKPGFTESEFPDKHAKAEFRAYLRGEAAALPTMLSSYYAGGRIGGWISKGWAVIVNAVPYRSPSLSREPVNQIVAQHLRSRAVHRRWLIEEALPEAAQGRRFVLIHRNRWWRIPQQNAGACVLFSDLALAEPNRKTPDWGKLDQAEDWLRRHG